MFPEFGRWAGETVAVIGSGPSACAEDVDACRGRVRVITVNESWRLAPWADVHYSSDHDWWALRLPEMRETCTGELWTGHPERIADDVRNCPYDKRKRGLSRTTGVIAWGGNSGYCAVGLAHQFGAARVLLIGFDMQGEHWHPEHPEPVRKPSNFPMWIERFWELSADARAAGLEILNCSRSSALLCFTRRTIKEALCSR